MGARGPAPTPTKILQARGSWRAAERDGEVQFPPGAADCPDWLRDEARAEWSRQSASLLAAGLFSTVDRALLAAYCEAWGEFRELAEWITANGGPAACWRQVGLKNAAADRVLRLAGQFGFSPAARTRIKGSEEPEANDKARFFTAG